MKTDLVDINYSPKQARFITSPFKHTFEVNEGSVRSGKTAADDARLAMFYLLSPDQNHLVSAYNQELAYNLFIEGDGLGLAYIFDGCSHLRRDRGGDHLAIDLPSGKKKVYFKGGAKINSANSIRGMSLGSVAYSEIDLMNREFIDETFRRTIKAKYRYHLADLNPPAPEHPVLELFEEYQASWLHWTMKDNPAISSERLIEIETEMKRNPYRYKRDWLGMRVMPQGIIYSMFDGDKMTDQLLRGDPVEMYFAGDAGQNDATTLSCNIVTRRKIDGRWVFVLNRVANYYHSGSETGHIKAMSTYAEELADFIRWCVKKFEMSYSVIMIDPAARSLREEFHKIGIPTSPANNNGHDVVGNRKGIEVGIERFQNLMEKGLFKIVEPPQSNRSDMSFDHYHFKKELSVYVRDDKTKKPVDANNHSLDEARYSVNYFYANYM